jgi:hypothetical protein
MSRARILSRSSGTIAGFLFFTDRGRRLGQRIDHALDEVVRELDHTRDTLHTVVSAYEGEPLIDKRVVQQERPPRTPSASAVRTSPP